ncbi:hypothetical protein YC2023_032059 [Brassica napus]
MDCWCWISHTIFIRRNLLTATLMPMIRSKIEDGLKKEGSNEYEVILCVNVNQSRYPLFPLLDIQCFFNSTFTRFVGYKYESYEQKIELLLLFPIQSFSAVDRLFRQNCFVLGGPKGDAHLSLYHHLNTFKDLQRQGSLYEFGDASVAIRFTDQTGLVDLASPSQPILT